MPTKSAAKQRNRRTRAARNGGSARTARGGTGNTSDGSLLQVLKAEHQEVKKLLKQLVNAEDAGEREEIFAKLKPELQGHAHGEEETLYPLLKQEDEAKTPAIEGFLEHHIAERLLEEMAAMADKGDEEWAARAKVLKDLVEHHIEEEEGEIWKEARKLLGNERLAEMTPDYRAVKERFM